MTALPGQEAARAATSSMRSVAMICKFVMLDNSDALRGPGREEQEGGCRSGP